MRTAAGACIVVFTRAERPSPKTKDVRMKNMNITAEHGIAAGRLPMHHRDPFDRMLVAQAQLEGLTLVTRDAHVQKYDVDVLTA